MKIEKVEKLVANLHDKTEYIIEIRNWMQALTHGLVLKKVQRVSKLNQKACLKPYVDMNSDLRKVAENDFEKNFSKWQAVFIFWKKWKIIRNIGTLNL